MIEDQPKSLGNLAAEFRRRVHRHEIVIGVADGKRRFRHFRRIEHGIIDVYAGLGLESRGHGLGKVIGPRKDIERVSTIDRAGPESKQTAPEAQKLKPRRHAPRKPSNLRDTQIISSVHE